MRILLGVFGMFLLFNCSGQEGTEVNTTRGVGVSGYDPVSYFSKTGPMKGDKKIEAEFEGVKYYFVRKENKEMFADSPKNYLPQYGGWCAYAMGIDGSLVAVDPLTYTIYEGKLFLFYNKFGNNTLLDWEKNEKELKIAADKFWRQQLIEYKN